MPQIFHSPNGTAGPAAWSLELVGRIRTLWVVKMLVTAFGIAAFMVIYFWLLRRPFLEVTIIPAMALDRMDWRTSCCAAALFFAVVLCVAGTRAGEKR